MAGRATTREQQETRNARALELYLTGMGVRQVAAALEVSYGTAYAAIQRAGGDSVFRNRGTRFKGE